MLRRPLDALLSVALAPRCAACDALLDSPSGGAVCPACWRSIRPLSPPLCVRCGDALASLPRAAGLPRLDLCAACRVHPPAVSLARSAGDYEGALRQAIHALKYDGRRGLAAGLARLMRERGAEVLTGADLAVPVPLHWRRRLARGFNQAEDLARGLGLPVCRALRRRRGTRPQFGLRPGERRRNVAGAFAPARGWRGRPSRAARRVRGACVVLVDDVATTGATLSACAEALARMGAREVRALTAARACRRPR